MRNTALMPTLSALGVALLVSSCAAEATAEEENTPAPEAVEASAEATEPLEEDNAEEFHQTVAEPTEEPERQGQATRPPDPVVVEHLECDDPEALAVKEQHNADRTQPTGWPQEWDGTGAMPDPLCHPDYLEIGEWVHHDEFHASWEGIQTSNIADDGQSQESINEGLWEQSEARADWSEEQWDG